KPRTVPQRSKSPPKASQKNTPTMGERVRRDQSHVFHEYDRRGGYFDGPTGTWRDHVGDPSVKETLTKGSGVLKEEILKWKSEMSVNELEEWPKPGDRKYLVQSEKPEERLLNMCPGAESLNGETSLLRESLYANTPRRTHGFLRICQCLHQENTQVLLPRAPTGMAPLHASRHADPWDGRVYMLNVNTWEEFDVAWMDLYTYPLYTRGGPYWQEVKIPFSKFLFTHRSAIQDDQLPLTKKLQKAYKVGITLKDQTDGPFSLEIDYIGVELDNDEHQEVSAYESYRLVRKNYTRM
ncbi:putative complex I intermediate-associated protein 30 mitochondrial, partial [Caligus rogercresseyi]